MRGASRALANAAAHLASRAAAPALVLLFALGGCGGDEVPTEEPTEDAEPVTAEFVLRGGNVDPVLVEGDANGLTVPLSLERVNGEGTPVTLSLEGRTLADTLGIEHAFDTNTLDNDGDVARMTLRLAIDDVSIEPHTRNFLVVASDGTRVTRTPIDVEIEPTDAPDVYLLIGQSNMVGSSGDGTRDAAPGGPDEPHPRVLQLNVTDNDASGIFDEPAAFTNPEANVVDAPIVLAEDPLHVPRDPSRGGDKGFEYIGPGLTFGKSALADTTRNVVLVPAAWSGSAFCDNENDPLGQWNAEPSEASVLGNTLLFDRALLRADIALAESGGILRGILWHQGESDANLPCATLYADNLAKLARGFRSRIAPDLRGPALRTPDAPIPFVVGTMSRGFVDSSDDYRVFNDAKQLIDDTHKAVTDFIPHSAVIVLDDLVPENGYPCGSGDCIHFGPRALREMGVRYHAALGRALEP